MYNLQPKTKSRPKKVKRRKFSTAAKTVATAASISALIGGWNLIGHLEPSQAAAGNAQPVSAPTSSNATSVQALPAVPPLVIKPVPTLPATGKDFAGAQSESGLRQPAPQVQAPAAPSVAPLPALPALPAMPSAPIFRRFHRRSGGS